MARTHNHCRAIVIAVLNKVVKVSRVGNRTLQPLHALDERHDRRRQRRDSTTEGLE